LGAGFDLGRRFDLVQSLEVAEHLPGGTSAAFVASLVRHSRGLVLFSAAPPGQGGENHINEQSYDFWRGYFREWGYYAIDWIRPRLKGDKTVSYWYRYNLILYASAPMLERLPDEVRYSKLPEDELIPDVSPPSISSTKAAGESANPVADSYAGPHQSAVLFTLIRGIWYHKVVGREAAGILEMLGTRSTGRRYLACDKDTGHLFLWKKDNSFMFRCIECQSTSIPVAGWLNRSAIEALLSERASGRVDHGNKRWALYILFSVDGRQRQRPSPTRADGFLLNIGPGPAE
jgi:hypothetical protein